jgi:phosphate/phosphite/phosphonate ABC transporter binding protein
MIRRFAWFSAILFLLCAGVAVAAPAAVKALAGAPDATVATEPKGAATLGMIVYADPRSQYAQIAPLAEFLGRQAGLQVNLKLYHDYFSLLNDLDHESLDLAMVSPLVYAICMDDPAITFLGTSLEMDKPFYHAVLLAKKDSPVRSVKDLAGRKVAFVDRYSASGYVYPAAFLVKEGLIKDGAPLYTPVFCGSHEKAMRALLEGQVDAAATYDHFFAFAGHRVGDVENLSLASFRILGQMPERIPNDAVVCRTALGKEIIDRLSVGLKQYATDRARPDSPLKSVFYTGFRPDTRAVYGEVRAFLEQLTGPLAAANPPATEHEKSEK